MKKKMYSKLISLMTAIIMVFAMSANIASAANASIDNPFPYLSSDCYLEMIVAPDTVPVYNSSSCTERGNDKPKSNYNSCLESGDCIQVDIVTPTFTHISKYPKKNGYGSGFCKTEDLFGVTKPQKVFTAAKSAKVYKMPGTNAAQYGSIANGDITVVTGSTTINGKKYFLVLYAAVDKKRGYKAGWVAQSELNSISSGVTSFSQNHNQPWSDYSYGRANGKRATLSSGGCGCLALTNVLYYATNGRFVAPEFIADYSIASGNRINDQGTKNTLVRDFLNKYGNQIGCRFVRDESTLSNIKEELAKGTYAAVAHVQAHFICVVSYRNKDKKYLVIDSYKSNARSTSKGYAWLTEEQFKGRLALQGDKPLHVIRKA